MKTQSDVDHLAFIRSSTEATLRAAIGGPQDVALLDAPAQINVGDSLIWQGQLAYMERLGYRVRYISDNQSYDPARLRKALPDGGTVLLRGGGNFGDLWVGHQDHRERVAQDLPDFPIVQLTQSVMFRDPARAVQANRILGEHPSFKLLVRDDLSLERASAALPDVPMAPAMDMALGWTPTTLDTPVGDHALVIAREDREAGSGLAKAASEWKTWYDIEVTDWGRHARYPLRWTQALRALRLNGKARRAQRKYGRFVPTMSQRTLESSLLYLNAWNVESAVRRFHPSRAMATDRLHAHVMASLIGIPHVVLDNSHGKISQVFDSYTGQFSNAFYVTSPAEAFEKLTSLVT